MLRSPSATPGNAAASFPTHPPPPPQTEAVRFDAGDRAENQSFPTFILVRESTRPLECGTIGECCLISTGEDAEVHRSEALKHIHWVRWD